MSGITGLMNLDRCPVHEEELKAMNALLAHRGPDGAGVWCSEHIGLGYQKLAATPESLHEWMPLASDAGAQMLVADVRIDNRDELLSQLTLTPKKEGVITDAEIILAAYQRWGVRCAKHLIGAFAFVIWDKARQHLYCARDHYALKPFYYAHIEGKRFVFASEIKSILSIKDVPKVLNERAVADHLLMPIKSDSAFTFYSHIFRLEPGHYLVVKPQKIRKEKYWEFDPTRELSYKSDAEYAEGLKEHFFESVKCRLRCPAPVGSMLSGGLDSSSIVGASVQLLKEEGKKLHTYSAVFDKIKLSDERPFINSVVQMYEDQLVPHFLSADSVSPFYDYDNVLWHQDNALRAGNMYFFWKLFEEARAEGVRVIMDGFDGDTTLSHGNGYLHELANNGRWFKLFQEVRLINEMWGRPWKKKMWKWVKVYGVAPWMDRMSMVRSVVKSGKKVTRRATVSTSNGASSLRWNHILNEQFAQEFKPLMKTRIGYPKTEREDHHRQLTQPLMHRIIESWESSAAAYGIELRLPFCDRRLMEYCLAMPPQQKRKNGWTRVSMRNAMKGVLPEDIRMRAIKGNLGPSFDHGLLVRSPEYLNKMLEQDTGGIGRYVNLKSLASSRPSYTAGKEGNNTIYHWRALSLALWLNYTGL